MMRHLKIFLIILIILAGVFVIGCTEKGEIKSSADKASDSLEAGKVRPDQKIRGAQIWLYDGPNKRAEIEADYIEKYTKQDSTLAWGLNVQFYDKDGAKSSHLVADSGLVRESINWMVANGDVVVITEDDSRLETEQLYWVGNKDIVRSDSFVTIYQFGDTLRGYGLETDPNLERIKIKERVSGVIQDAEELEE